MTKPDRFERLAQQAVETVCPHGIEAIYQDVAIKLLRAEHKAVVRAVKNFMISKAAYVAGDSSE